MESIAGRDSAGKRVYVHSRVRANAREWARALANGDATESGDMPVARIHQLARVAPGYSWVQSTHVDREEEGKDGRHTGARIASAGSLDQTNHQLG